MKVFADYWKQLCLGGWLWRPEFGGGVQMGNTCQEANGMGAGREIFAAKVLVQFLPGMLVFEGGANDSRTSSGFAVSSGLSGISMVNYKDPRRRLP